MRVEGAEPGEWLETSLANMKAVMKRDFSKQGYFAYKGKIICEFGKSEELQKDLDTPMSERIHGKSEGTVIINGAEDVLGSQGSNQASSAG